MFLIDMLPIKDVHCRISLSFILHKNLVTAGMSLNLPMLSILLLLARELSLE